MLAKNRQTTVPTTTRWVPDDNQSDGSNIRSFDLTNDGCMPSKNEEKHKHEGQGAKYRIGKEEPIAGR